MDHYSAKSAQVGGLGVARVLPQRQRRTIGAWCFLDHFGPTDPGGDYRMKVGPHPHIGLSTVTWLYEGQVMHSDSLGYEQLIRPGQLNLMVAGHGIAHAEETPIGHRGQLHGVQFWIAQPDAARHDAPAFEHHAELPELEFDNAGATVMLGSFLGETAATRVDTPIIGVELEVRPGDTAVPLSTSFEHGVAVIDGSVRVLRRGAEHVDLAADELLYLDPGADEVTLRCESPAKVMLLGGEPFEAPVMMWWNFVGRERAEVELAAADWNAGSDRFGTVRTSLDRIPAPPVPWGGSPASAG